VSKKLKCFVHCKCPNNSTDLIGHFILFVSKTEICYIIFLRNKRLVFWHAPSVGSQHSHCAHVETKFQLKITVFWD
jgi:hypothetical protein